MKKSNAALLGLALTLLVGMVVTGFILKQEAAKIDLRDLSRNYFIENVAAFKVLKVSGSNGYPIEIKHGNINSISVLRRRKSFLKTIVQGDTLEIIFSGANMPPDQAGQSTTPAGVIIKSNSVAQIRIKDTYNRIKGFRQGRLDMRLEGNSSADFLNCHFSILTIAAKNNSRFGFKHQNTADTINFRLANNTLAYLKNISFSVLQHQVGDSATVVLSNQSLTQLYPQADPE
jgi:hypothetical protein